MGKLSEPVSTLYGRCYQEGIALLGKEADPNAMDDDWVANFFEKTRIISDDEMQTQAQCSGRSGFSLIRLQQARSSFVSDTPDIVGSSRQIVAVRGASGLTYDELQAHLATLVRLENIGLFLGSGCSCGDVGGKTIKQLWEDFCTSAPDDYNYLMNKGFIDKTTEKPNVELLLDSLEIALSEWKRQGRTKLEKQLRKAYTALRRSIVRATVLKEEWWCKPQYELLTAPQLQNHRIVIQRLLGTRQPGQPGPWIFTTNYDLATEWTAESIGVQLVNGFSGLHNRSFSPHVFDMGFRNLQARGEAQFGVHHINLVKLHGSLTWQMSDDKTTYIELPARSVWSSLSAFLNGKEGANDLPVIYPSAAKYMQTVGFAFGELLRRFMDFLGKPQTALITCGYSFSDAHLNEMILRALQNPSLHLVIFLPELEYDVTRKRMCPAKCSEWVRRISSLESPQVTLVGGGDAAHFDKLAEILPTPAIYDEQAIRIRQLLRELRANSKEQTQK